MVTQVRRTLVSSIPSARLSSGNRYGRRGGYLIFARQSRPEVRRFGPGDSPCFVRATSALVSGRPFERIIQRLAIGIDFGGDIARVTFPDDHRSFRDILLGSAALLQLGVGTLASSEASEDLRFAVPAALNSCLKGLELSRGGGPWCRSTAFKLSSVGRRFVAGSHLAIEDSGHWELPRTRGHSAFSHIFTRCRIATGCSTCCEDVTEYNVVERFDQMGVLLEKTARHMDTGVALSECAGRRTSLPFRHTSNPRNGSRGTPWRGLLPARAQGARTHSQWREKMRRLVEHHGGTDALARTAVCSNVRQPLELVRRLNHSQCSSSSCPARSRTLNVLQHG